MERKIIIGMIVIGIILLSAIGVMTYILLTREPMLEAIVEEAEEVVVVEPPPLEEDALKEATLLVGERLRVFDVEERQDKMLKAIQEQLLPGMDTASKKQMISEVVNLELTVWKEQVIRDTLLELHGEYSSEDYFEIDRKTNISQLITFVTGFEMEVLGIK